MERISNLSGSIVGTQRVRLSKPIVSQVLFNIIIVTVTSICIDKIGLLLVCLLGNVFMLTVIGVKERELLESTYMCLNISFIIIIVIYCVLMYYYGEPYVPGFSDDLNFEKGGFEYYCRGVFKYRDTYPIQDLTGTEGYLVLISNIQRITSGLGGFHTLYTRFFNAFVWISVCGLMYKQLASVITQKEKLKKVFCVVALFPNVFRIIGFSFRDTIVLLFVYGIYYITSEWRKDFENHRFGNKPLKLLFQVIGMAFCTYNLYYYRKTMLVIAVLVSFISLFWARKRFLCIVVVAAVFVAVTFVYIMRLFPGLNLIIEKYSEYRIQENGNGMASIIFGVPFFPLGVFFRMIYSFICPFPGALLSLDWSRPGISLLQSMIYLGTIVQIFFLPYLFKGLIKLDRVASVFLIIEVMSVCLVYNFRYHLYLYPFAVYIISNELCQVSRTRKKANLGITVVALMFLGIVYLLIKW